MNVPQNFWLLHYPVFKIYLLILEYLLIQKIMIDEVFNITCDHRHMLWFSVGSVAPAFTGRSPSIKIWSQHFNSKSSIQLKSGKKFRHPTLWVFFSLSTFMFFESQNSLLYIYILYWRKIDRPWAFSFLWRRAKLESHLGIVRPEVANFKEPNNSNEFKVFVCVWK